MSGDSDPPASDSDPPQRDEITGIHDVPRPMRRWAESHSRRLRKVEKHFEEKGMVYEVHADWSALKRTAGWFKWIAPMVGSLAVALIVGILWLINHAATQPRPPSVEELGREIAKQQQK